MSEKKHPYRVTYNFWDKEDLEVTYFSTSLERVKSMAKRDCPEDALSCYVEFGGCYVECLFNKGGF